MTRDWENPRGFCRPEEDRSLEGLEKAAIGGRIGAHPTCGPQGALFYRMRQVGLGIGIGLLGALGLTRFMRTLLFGVEAVDTVTFVGVAAGLLLAGLVASCLPAWRAARLNPVKARRYE